jgi:hypothetical protein
LKQLAERQAAHRQRPELQKTAARNTITVSGPITEAKLEHGEFSGGCEGYLHLAIAGEGVREGMDTQDHINVGKGIKVF